MKIKDWLQLYLSHMVNERRVAKSTEQSYSSDLNDFIKYLDKSNLVDANELRTHHLTSYLNDLRAEGRSTATISRRIVSIRTFCKFLTVQRALDYNPAIQLESPKTEKKSPQALSSVDMNKLLDLPDTTQNIGLRDRAMLELLYATGLRVSELIALDEEHVRLDMGFLLCLGSGGRERMVPVGAQGAAWVSKYLEAGRPHLIKAYESEAALFVNHLGSRLTRQGFWKVMKKYAAILNLAITPHTLRHSFATHLLDNGADIRAVQEMLGHAAPSTTQMYQSSVKLKLKEVYERSHPRART